MSAYHWLYDQVTYGVSANAGISSKPNNHTDYKTIIFSSDNN